MGWCSGTEIFDDICGDLLNQKALFKKTVIALIKAFEANDWDCQQDSKFYDHPIVREAFEELHPDWFWYTLGDAICDLKKVRFINKTADKALVAQNEAIRIMNRLVGID